MAVSQHVQRTWLRRYGTTDPDLPRCSTPGCGLLALGGTGRCRRCARNGTGTRTVDVPFVAEPAPYDWLDHDCLLPVRKDNGQVMANYGAIHDDQGRHYAHTWRWKQTYGDIPDGLMVLHRCDNPPCFELSHLYLGTAVDNMADMHARGRARNGLEGRTHCKRGHEMTPENTYVRPNGACCCRICRRLHG